MSRRALIILMNVLKDDISFSRKLKQRWKSAVFGHQLKFFGRNKVFILIFHLLELPILFLKPCHFFSTIGDSRQ